MGQPPRKLTYGELSPELAEATQRLVANCPPLVLHTPFTYWVILSRSQHLSIGAFDCDSLVGAVLAIPSLSGAAFVWQIGVHQELRGQRIAGALLERCWKAARTAGLKALEVTIDPKNEASLSTFTAFAEVNNLTLEMGAEIEVRDGSGNLVEREIEYRLH